MAYYFDESYYLHSKLAQLKLAGEKTLSGQDWDLAGLNARLKADGLTPQSHYEQWGRAEGLNPNAYFNEYEYLHAKLKQLHSIDERDARGNAYTLQTLKDKIAADGMTAATHYERYGAYETDADGNRLNPSNGFDANAYFWTKLAECRKSGETVHGHTGNAITMADLITAMKLSGMSPVTHYKLYGANEAGQYSTAMVQSVPMSQRVANDPGRETVTDEALPGNYNPATPAPTDNASYSGLAKPGDLGGLVGDSSLSLIPVVPDHSPLIPGQAGYQAPPVTIRDVAVNPIFAPTGADAAKISGNWLVVNAPRGVAYVIKADGAVLGQIVITVRDNTFSATHDRVFLYTDAALTDASVHKVRQSDLPPSITVDPSKQNNFDPPVPPPPPPPFGILVADAAFPGNVLVIRETLPGGSSVTVDANGLATPTGGEGSGTLGSEKFINAAAVTGTGKLTINSAAFDGKHLVKGSDTVANEFILGKNVGTATGGANDDVFTIHAQHADDTASIVLGGSGPNGDLVRLAAGATADVPFGGISGTDQADRLRIDGGGNGHRLDVLNLHTLAGNDTLSLFNVIVSGSGVGNGALTGAGDDHVTVGTGGQVTTLDTGAGLDTVIVERGGSVTTLTTGLDTELEIDTVTVRDSGTSVTTLNTGAGQDVVTVTDRAWVNTVNTGANNDTVSLYNGAWATVINTGAGSDLVILGAGCRADSIDLGDDDDQARLYDGAAVLTGLALGAGVDLLHIWGAVNIGGTGIDGGSENDNVYIHTGRTVDLTAGLKSVERLNLINTIDKQSVIFDADKLGTGVADGEILAFADAGRRDTVAIRNLTTNAGSAAAVNARGEWHYDSAANDLYYFNFDDGVREKIRFNNAGHVVHNPGGNGVLYWMEGAATAPLDGLQGAYLSPTLTVSGAADAGDMSKVVVAAGGAMTVNGAAVTGAFAADNDLDAQGVTGPGRLVIDTSGFTDSHTVYGSGTADNLALLGSLAVTYYGGAGADEIVLQAGHLFSTGIYLRGAAHDADHIHLAAGALSGATIGNIDGDDSNDRVRIEGDSGAAPLTTGAINLYRAAAGGRNELSLKYAHVNGDIAGYSSSDHITLESGVTVSGTIWAQDGADVLDLGAANAVTVRQSVGSSGNFTAPASGETVNVAAFDRMTGLNAATIRVDGYTAAANWSNGGGALAEYTSFSGLNVGDNRAALVRGFWRGDDGPGGNTFTASADGSDALLVYDSYNSAAQNVEAVLLTGVYGLAVTINASGEFAFT